MLTPLEALRSAVKHRARISFDDIDGANLLAAFDRLQADAARYQFIRAGNVYIEPNDQQIYMAIESGKYYSDMRDMDMDLDEAIAEAAPKPGEKE